MKQNIMKLIQIHLKQIDLTSECELRMEKESNKHEHRKRKKKKNQQKKNIDGVFKLFAIKSASFTKRDSRDGQK